MLEPIIISVAIVLATPIGLAILSKKKKLQKGMIHRIEIIGIYIPTSFIVIYYSYIATDILKDSVIVASLIIFGLVIIFIENKYAKTYNYNWLISPCSIILIFLVYVKLNSYTLNEYNIVLISSVIGSMTSVNLKIKLNRKKLRVSTIVTTILVLILSSSYDEEIKRESKPIRYAIEYTLDKGYEINSDDIIHVSSKVNSRLKPIEIYIISTNKNTDKLIMLEMKYYKGEIGEFQVEGGKI